VNRLDREKEDALVQVWSACERDDHTLEKLCTGRPDLVSVVSQLEADGWLRRRNGSIEFTEPGEQKARELVRRHRLAEVLLEQVLEVSREQAAYTACLWEHMLSEEVAGTICTFLGHPRHCPHGNPIPPGLCCQRMAHTVTPLVQPLASLRVGATARVTFISSKVHRRLDRLAALGIVPGTEIVLHQRFPSYILRAGETEVAVEESVARDIFVREANGKGE